MSSLLLLYINDRIAGRCLELIRKICDPDSTSKPHVTVRGPFRGYSKDYIGKEEKISRLELLEAGCFFTNGNEKVQQNTVYLRCDFEQLKSLYYKPDYLGSPPHVTLYDGTSRKFAEKLFSCIKDLDWNCTVELPKVLNAKTRKLEFPKLTEIKLKNKKKRPTDKKIDYSTDLKALYNEITGSNINYNEIIGLSDDEKLLIIKKINQYFKTNCAKKNIHISKFRSNTNRNSIELPSFQKNELIKYHQLDLFEEIQAQTKDSKPRSLRNRLGQFPTPPELAFEIVTYLKKMPTNFSKIKFGDPSVGTGTFYYALEQLFPMDKIHDAIGVEVDNNISETTQKFWPDNKLKIIKDDFFSLKNLPKRNLIICNPPYVRYQYINNSRQKYLKSLIKNQLSINISGLSSLYVYFILFCHQWMEENAIAAWLVPTEFMDVNYGAALRQYLTNYVSPILIHRYDSLEVQFEGVLVSSCVIIIKKQLPSTNYRFKVSYGGSLLNPKRVDTVKLSEFRNKIKWPRNIQSIDTKHSPKITLGDLFEVKRGIATGANSFFIIPIEKAKTFKIPEKYLKPILPSPRYLKNDIITSEKDGYPNLSMRLVLIDCDLPEDNIKKTYPEFYEYLRTANELEITSRTLVKKRHPWYKQERRKVPPFLCTYLGRTGRKRPPIRFIWNRSNALATNLYLHLYPKNQLFLALKEEPHIEQLIFDHLQAISNETLTNGGRIYGGGLFKIEPSELKRIPADKFLNIIKI